MSELNAQLVQEYLKARSPAELLQILSPVLEARAERDADSVEKLVLCSYFRCINPPLADPDWYISMLALPPSLEDWRAHESCGYWESGYCPSCNREVGSYAKKAVCPLCEVEVELT